MNNRRSFLKSISSVFLGVALSTPLAVLCKKEKPKVVTGWITGRDQNNVVTEEPFVIEFPITKRQLVSFLGTEEIFKNAKQKVTDITGLTPNICIVSKKVKDLYGTDLIKKLYGS